MKRMILSALLATVCWSGFGQWSNDPATNNPVSTVSTSGSTATKLSPVSAPDGSGGMFIAWEDNRNSATSGTDIYIQRVLANGSVAFAAGGIAVTTAAGNQTNIYMVSDSAGGVILVWQDARNAGSTGDDIYGQRISSTGTALWASNGVQITNGGGTNTTQATPLIAMINTTEAVVTWRDSRGASSDPYANKILISTGATQWTDVQLSNAAGIQTNYGIVADGLNGAIITWEDPSGTPSVTTDRDLFGQRLNNSGTKLWSPASAIGHSLIAVTGTQQQPAITADGAGGIVMVWADQRSGTTGGGDIFAQRFNAAGSKVWAADVQIVSAAGIQSNPFVVKSGSDFIYTWSDPRLAVGNRDIYVQKTNENGALQWTPAGGAMLDGVPVVVQTGHQPASSTSSGIMLLSDSTGGAFVVWDDARAGSSANPDMYAQKISPTGTMLWATDGVVVSNATNGQKTPAAVVDKAGGIIVGWADSRNANVYNEIWASRVFADGTLPVNFVSISAAINRSEINVSWKATCDAMTSHFVIEKSADGRSFSSIGSVQAPAVTAACLIDQNFIDKNPVNGNNYYRVKGVDKDGKLTYSSIARVPFGGKLDAQVQLYPNPAKDVVNVQLHNLAKGNYTIRIADAAGKSVQAVAVGVQLPFQQQIVQLANLQSGNYFVSIIDENGKVVGSKQLVKQ